MKTINEFLKDIQKHFGHVEYKATSKDGLVFKSKGWRDSYDSVHFNEVQSREFLGKD